MLKINLFEGSVSRFISETSMEGRAKLCMVNKSLFYVSCYNQRHKLMKGKFICLLISKIQKLFLQLLTVSMINLSINFSIV